jgi:tripeptide aminopeptidase
MNNDNLDLTNRLKERFLRYISFNTQSNPRSGNHPSTDSQLEFAKMLADELIKIGLCDVSVDEKAYIMGTLPSNIGRKAPAVGFIAHIDSSPDYSAQHIKPQIIDNYNGRDIVLNTTLDIVMKVNEFPELTTYVGQTLITTDGTTLLSADDKAGVAEIVTAVEYLIENPQIERGDIKIGFTPDEEIGQGADFFDVEKFGAAFAYTLDGDEVGVLEFENFNAAGATVTFRGRMVHPGSAKGKMVNSLHIARKFMSMLPSEQAPEHTENYEGFFHLMSVNGNVEKTIIEYIIRDHDKTLFEKKKLMMQGIAAQLNLEFDGAVELEMKDQYYNMLEKIEPVKYIVDLAHEAMLDCGIQPRVKPIRGGTDGARLSYMGLPCPNIFAGGLNFHGPYEFVSLQSMNKAVEVILKIVEKVKDL